MKLDGPKELKVDGLCKCAVCENGWSKNTKMDGLKCLLQELKKITLPKVPIIIFMSILLDEHNHFCSISETSHQIYPIERN